MTCTGAVFYLGSQRYRVSVMNKTIAIMAVQIAVIAGYSSLTVAHSLPNNSVGLPGSGAAKSDIYNVHCYDDGAGPTEKLFFHVQARDNAATKGPVVSIKAKKGAATPGVDIDANKGDTAWVIPTAVAGGDGEFTVVVNKSAYTGKAKENLGAQVYSGVAHCQTSSGGHTGTDIMLIQNE